MKWIDNAREVSLKTQQGLQAAPIGARRWVGWEHPAVTGVASEKGTLLNLDEKTGQTILNDPIAKMAGPVGVYVDPIGSRMYPAPTWGTGMPTYGAGEATTLADDIAETSHFWEILHRDTIALNEEIKRLNQNIFQTALRRARANNRMPNSQKNASL